MKEKFLLFIQQNYRRYHDTLFYLLALGVIVTSTFAALHITNVKNEQERANLQEKEISVQEFTIKDKPIYIALQESGISSKEVAAIVSKLSSVADTRKLQKRDTYSLSVDPSGHFIMLLLTQGFKRYFVANVEGSLVAGVSDVEIKTRVQTAAGEISSSLFAAMTKDGLGVPLILDFTDAFSWTIDFNTDTRKGDRYTALWEEHYTAGGEITGQDLLAASYTGEDGKTLYAFYFEDDFYDETGKMSKKMFLKSPISFRNYRISSRFSYSRKHPILKIRRPHLGIDYAAPSGTPVQTVADGTVKFVGWKGGFGNFVEIKHANGYVTMYGHLKGYGKGIKAGAKVKQGQTVGYVGSTGLSTGPHLDFRIKEKNKFIDFLKMKNRNSAVRDVPADKRKEFEELKLLYLKELNAAQQQEEQPSAAEEKA